MSSLSHQPPILQVLRAVATMTVEQESHESIVLRIAREHTLQLPELPQPWKWQCHKCKSVYNLSVTRRCLLDGHYYCHTTEHAQVDMRSPHQKKPPTCRSAFDRAGWQKWSGWRRIVHALAEYDAVEPLSVVEPMFGDADDWNDGKSCERPSKRVCRDNDYKMKKNCWLDCDSPGECIGRL